MAKYFRKHFIFDLQKHSPLGDSGDLGKVLDLSSKVRLVWGHYKYVNSPYKLAEEKHVNFHYEKTEGKNLLLPADGSHELLGCSEYGFLIEVKAYTLEEFIDLVQKTNPSEFVLIDVKNQKEISIVSVFSPSTLITSHLDFPQMITDLEQRKLLTICESINILRTDERRFSLLPDAGNIIPTLKNHIGKIYEVDILGTK